MAYTTIDDPSAYFQTAIYTGNGSANLAITNDGNSDLQPDLVWIKNRDADDSHCLFDSTRGATKLLSSDTTATEATDADTLDSFASDGFQVDADVKVNTNTEKYVAWQWKANGGSTSTNTTGSSNDVTIQTNSTSGFSIMIWSGDGGTSSTVGHGLGAIPNFIISKLREDAQNWSVAWPHFETSKLMALNTNAGFGTASGLSGYNTTVWTDGNGGITSGTLAYAWKEVQGFSKFGSYVANEAEPKGTFIYTGFKPAMVIWKAGSEDGQAWVMGDNKREPFNMMVEKLFPNSSTSTSGAVGDNNWDFVSNGFKLRTQDPALNKDGVTYYYAAFAHQPFVTSGGVPCTAH
jgi:hypothetical protein